MAQQQLQLAKTQLVVIHLMLLLALAAIAPKSARAATECSTSTSTTSGGRLCNDQQDLQDQQPQGHPADLSLFQRGHQVTKMPAGLGLIGPEAPGAPHRALDLREWISPDVSSAIDFLFVAVIGAMILRWRQNQTTQKNSPGGVGQQRKGGSGSEKAAAKQQQQQRSSNKGGALSRAEQEEQDLNAKKPLGLHLAVVSGEIAMCEQALAKAGVSVEQKDYLLCTPLHLAAHRGSVPVMEWLLTHGARVNAREAWDQTPLHFAAQAGHTKACELLVGYGADLSAKDAQDRTALLLAGQNGHAATAESLIRMGATLGNASESHVPALLNNLILQRMLEEIGKGGQSSEAPPKPPAQGRAGAGLGL